jgi:hypothetical protein
MTNPTHVAVPNDVFQSMMKYISTKPYAEVSALFVQINATAQGIVLQPVEAPADTAAANGGDAGSE